MAYPILAPNSTWYKSNQNRSTITQINIVDSYTPTGNENETWNADVGNTGSIKCYRTGTVITIAGNGSGKIAMNADSSYAFSSSGSNRFDVLTTIAGADLLDTSNVTSFERLFYVCKKLKTVDVSNWQTGNVTNMHGTFNQVFEIEQIPVENWDTSSCENMKYMFQLCLKLKSLDLSKWNVSKVKTMSSMFLGHSAFGDMTITSVNTSGWNTSSLEDTSGMFQRCPQLTSLDVSSWDVSKVQTMQSMFMHCSSLTSLDVSNWNTSSCKNMSFLFQKCTNLEILDVSKWNTSSVTDMESLFSGCQSLTILDISNWDVSKVTSMQNMFTCGADYGTNQMSYTALDVSKWNTSSCTNMSFMFYGVDTIGTINVSNWNVSKVTNFDHMFAHSHINIGDISKWDTSSATNMNGMFHSIQNTTIDVSNFNTSKVFAFGQMFEYCNKLTSIIGLENFDTSSGIDFAEMFHGCTQLKELNLSNFDTRNAKDGVNVSTNGGTSLTMYNIVYDTPCLEKITLGENFSFNGDGTTTNASNIAVLPTPDSTYITGADGKWYTVIGTSYLPAEIPSKTANTYYASVDIVKNLDVKLKNGTIIDIAAQIKEKTGKADNIKPSAMADEISKISGGSTELPTLSSPASTSEVFLNKEYIDSAGTKQVGTFTIDSELNNQDNLLNQIELALQDKASGGITPTGEIEITENGTYDVTNYASALVNIESSGDSNSENALLSRQITEYSNSTLTTIGSYAFSGVPVTSLNLPAVTTIAGYAFYECTTLQNLTLESLTQVPYNGFRQYKGLVKGDFHAITKIGQNGFYQCTSLETLIIRTPTVCELSAGTIFNGSKIFSGTGYIYVPSTLVDNYKTATNWATYADQIRAIEDYPEICG